MRYDESDNEEPNSPIKDFKLPKLSKSMPLEKKAPNEGEPDSLIVAEKKTVMITTTATAKGRRPRMNLSTDRDMRWKTDI